MNKLVRIGGGQGFWGDSLEAPIDLVRQGPLNYLVLDYLAELTMSILAKQREKDPGRGYAHDFVDTVARIAQLGKLGEVKIVANAGGMNPHGCAIAVREKLAALGISPLPKIGVITGDDIKSRIPELLSQGVAFTQLEDGRPFSTVADKVQSANAYMGCASVVEALHKGADIVITGRVADPSLVLGCLVHEFGWSLDDQNELALGTIAGHVIECGAQASGGNCSYKWEEIPNLAEIGYPIIEADGSDSVVITKHSGTGGRVDLRTVKEQLVYEIGDPTAYTTPDVVADFTSIELSEDGKDRVRIRNARGGKRPEQLKVSLSYRLGYRAEGTLIYSWPDAAKKARAAGEIIRKRLVNLGLTFEEIHTDVLGVNGCHGDLPFDYESELPEAVFRMAVRDPDRSKVDRFTREIAPLVLNGPPSVSGYTGGRPKVVEVYGYWPTLVPRSLVQEKVELI